MGCPLPDGQPTCHAVARPRVGAVVGLLIFVVLIALTVQLRRRGGSGPGPGAAGAVYDLLNQDRRNAIEIILEERAERRDPEDADGNLPDLEDPKR